MPLDQIGSLELPEFSCGYDTMNHQEITTFEKGVLARDLLQRPIGSKAMLFLRNLNQNQLTIGFKNKFKLRIKFPVDLFGTLGIWWNNYGYPDEEGCRRNECAFEPISGPGSCLVDAYQANMSQTLELGEKTSWRITWEIIP
jgi:hypothetical protein